MKFVSRFLILLVVLLTGPAFVFVSDGLEIDGDWSNANRTSAGIAPDPAVTTEAVVQVYAARAFEWRGAFAVHSWIAVKPEGAASFTSYEVMGWHVRRGGGAVRVRRGAPDIHWYGAPPQLLAELRGDTAARAIPKIQVAVAAYPYPESYVTWPGPNSNTFTAAVLREVPEVGADLPPTAIGKDFLPGGAVFGRAPSGGGLQVSLYGLVGVLVSGAEGLEVNVLGLAFGVDPGELALRLPGVGKVGFALDRPTEP